METILLTPERTETLKQPVVLKIATGHDVLEIAIDADQPVVPMTNNAVTWLYCLCGEHLISSQRQLDPDRSVYHVHCRKCGRAGSVAADVWRKMLNMLAPQLLAG